MIGLLTAEAANLMNLDGLENVFIINREDVKSLSNITAFIATDIEFDTVFPESSWALSTTHGCTRKYDSDIAMQFAFTTCYSDGYLVGYKFIHKANELKSVLDNFPVPDRFPVRKKGHPFYILGYGYPKLCMSSKKYKNLLPATVKNCICYAPHCMDYLLNEGGYRIKNYGLRLIRALLKNFPDYNIIFRPAPEDRAHVDTRAIIDFFENEPRFYIDLQNDYIETFARSKILITDFSHVASNFNIITTLPAMYFRPWQNKKEPHICANTYYAYSFTQLISCIHKALEMQNIPESVIRDGLLPFDNSLDELADDFRDFINGGGGQKHSRWLPVSRDKPASPLLLSRIILPVLQAKGNTRMGYAKFYARFFNSKPLALLALQICKQEYPEGSVEESLLKLSGLNKIVSKYADINVNDLAALYLQAIQNLKRDTTLSREDKSAEIALLAELSRIAAQGLSLN